MNHRYSPTATPTLSDLLLAVAVCDRAIPEVVRAVKARDITLEEAVRICLLPPGEQRQDVQQVADLRLHQRLWVQE